jgi:hypothetical protein
MTRHRGILRRIWLLIERDSPLSETTCHAYCRRLSPTESREVISRAPCQPPLGAFRLSDEHKRQLLLDVLQGLLANR